MKKSEEQERLVRAMRRAKKAGNRDFFFTTRHNETKWYVLGADRRYHAEKKEQ